MCFQINRDNGLWYSAEYSSFSLGPESDKYRLSVSGYSGDAGDALAAPALPTLAANGMQFSCLYEDNDMHPTAHCSSGKNGWWYNWCSRSFLNRNGKACWHAVTTAVIKDVIFSRMLIKLD